MAAVICCSTFSADSNSAEAGNSAVLRTVTNAKLPEN
jgi:hypothetical protein